MDNEALVKAFHAGIIRAATETLGRPLTEKEMRFITSRGGFLALEMIEDAIRDATKEKIEQILNSE